MTSQADEVREAKRPLGAAPMTDANETLDWEQPDDDYDQYADTKFGPVAIEMRRSEDDEERYELTACGNLVSTHDSMQAAKAAAEKWYFDRLTQALEPVTRGE